MVHIAIVEDDPIYQKQLQSYLELYEKEENTAFKISVFSDGLDISDPYTPIYDIIFLDIQMKHLDGISTAKSIRRSDDHVVIIFITNLSQFALHGYQVEALSYVLKPIQYFAFSQELRKALRKVRAKKAAFIHINQDGRIVRLDVSKITHVEVSNHLSIYHTTDGDYSVRDTLRHAEDLLAEHGFSRSSNSFLVNLAYVEQVGQTDVQVAGSMLPISRSRKKAFMESLAEYIGKR